MVTSQYQFIMKLEADGVQPAPASPAAACQAVKNHSSLLRRMYVLEER